MRKREAAYCQDEATHTKLLDDNLSSIIAGVKELYRAKLASLAHGASSYFGLFSYTKVIVLSTRLRLQLPRLRPHVLGVRGLS